MLCNSSQQRVPGQMTYYVMLSYKKHMDTRCSNVEGMRPKITNWSLTSFSTLYFEIWHFQHVSCRSFRSFELEAVGHIYIFDKYDDLRRQVTSAKQWKVICSAKRLAIGYLGNNMPQSETVKNNEATSAPNGLASLIKMGQTSSAWGKVRSVTSKYQIETENKISEHILKMKMQISRRRNKMTSPQYQIK